MAKKKAAPVKKSAPVKKAAPVKRTGAGRPKGAENYVPSKPLEVRDSGKFKGTFEGAIGPRWVRVYAADQPNSLLLAALAKLVKDNDPALMKLLKQKAK